LLHACQTINGHCRQNYLVVQTLLYAVIYFTMHLFSGGYMLFSSNGSTTGTAATLFSPLITSLGISKLTFYYHMLLKKNDRAAALTIYSWSSNSDNQILFNATGNRGVNWQNVTLCLPAGIYRLAFVGVVGIPSLSDLAIDDITISSYELACSYLIQPTGYGESNSFYSIVCICRPFSLALSAQ
jgi:MAM domain, meprin/A5/mu